MRLTHTKTLRTRVKTLQQVALQNPRATRPATHVAVPHLQRRSLTKLAPVQKGNDQIGAWIVHSRHVAAYPALKGGRKKRALAQCFFKASLGPPFHCHTFCHSSSATFSDPRFTSHCLTLISTTTLALGKCLISNSHSLGIMARRLRDSHMGKLLRRSRCVGTLPFFFLFILHVG
jgi:hypothetical protein